MIVEYIIIKMINKITHIYDKDTRAITFRIEDSMLVVTKGEYDEYFPLVNIERFRIKRCEGK